MSLRKSAFNLHFDDGQKKEKIIKCKCSKCNNNAYYRYELIIPKKIYTVKMYFCFNCDCFLYKK